MSVRAVIGSVLVAAILVGPFVVAAAIADRDRLWRRVFGREDDGDVE